MLHVVGSPGPAGPAGPAGPRGEAGAPGAPGTLVSVMTEPSGPNCPAGGQRIDLGTDSNGNGILDKNEIQNTAYICNGQPGGASNDDPDVPGDANCDGFEGDLARGIFVAPIGNDTNPGTQLQHKQTIQAAVTFVAANRSAFDHVYVAEGTYLERVTLADGVSLYGGYSLANWARSPALVTRISQTSLVGGFVETVEGAVRHLHKQHGAPDHRLEPPDLYWPQQRGYLARYQRGFPWRLG